MVERRSPSFGRTGAAYRHDDPVRGRVIRESVFMSQHNISGSEAFDRAPFVLIRSVRAGGMRRRRSRSAMAFIAGAAVAVIGGGIAVALMFGPSLAG